MFDQEQWIKTKITKDLIASVKKQHFSSDNLLPYQRQTRNIAAMQVGWTMAKVSSNLQFTHISYDVGAQNSVHKQFRFNQVLPS